MGYLFQASRHLGLTAAIHQERLFGAHSQRCAHRVHRSVTTTNHCHARSARHRCGISISAAVHQVHTCQIFVARQNIDEIFARNTHKARQAGAAGYKNTLVALCHQVVVAQGLTYYHVGVKFHTHCAQGVEFGIYYHVGQTEFGNTIFEHAAHLVKCFIHSHREAATSHIAGKRQPGRTGANHGHAYVERFGHLRFGAIGIYTSAVGCIAFEPADCYRLFLHLIIYATAFALALLRTYASAHCRECRGATQHCVGLNHLASLDIFDKSGNVNAYRTAGHTLRVGAIQASARFGMRHLGRQAAVHFLIGMDALLRSKHRHLRSRYGGALFRRHRSTQFYAPLRLACIYIF